MPKGVQAAPATKLHALRLKSKVSRADVAAAAGISVPTYAKIETGQMTTVKPEVGSAIAAHFGKKTIKPLLAAVSA